MYDAQKKRTPHKILRIPNKKSKLTHIKWIIPHKIIFIYLIFNDILR